MLLGLIGVAWAADPVQVAPASSAEGAELKAHALQRAGMLELGGGLAGFGGGIAVLSIGRGPPDQLSDETVTEINTRGILGGVFMVAGVTGALVGLHELSEAKAWREEAARRATVWVGPGGAGIAVTW